MFNYIIFSYFIVIIVLLLISVYKPLKHVVWIPVVLLSPLIIIALLGIGIIFPIYWLIFEVYNEYRIKTKD